MMQQNFLSQQGSSMDYAEPGRPAARFTGRINSSLGLPDFAERLAELDAAQRAVARAAAAVQTLTECWSYAESSGHECCKIMGACCEALPSLEGFAERMGELAQRMQQATAAANIYDLAYAVPGLPAGRPSCIDSDLALADFSQCLAELMVGSPAPAAAAYIPAMDYAASGCPRRKAGAAYVEPEPLTMADFNDRLEELTGHPAAMDAFEETMAYAAPGRPQPLTPADFSQRLSELVAAFPAPALAAYTAAMDYAAAGRPLHRAAGPPINSDLTPADLSERLAELAAACPMAVPFALEEYAEPGLPQRSKGGARVTRVPSAYCLERAQFASERMWELVAHEVAAGRLHELAAWGYAEEGLSETKAVGGKHLAPCWREGFAFNWVALETMNERLYELAAAAAV